MKEINRFDENIDAYYFPSLPLLAFHSNYFWYNDKKVRIVYNNGSKAVLVGKTKYGIQKLRKEAVLKKIKLTPCPF